MDFSIGGYEGVFGLILLVLVIWAILGIVQSKAGNGTKALWIVLVLVLPLLGFILWLLLGPKGRA